MPIPATTGQLREKISDMQIGDYIKIGWNASGVQGINNGTTEIPLSGQPAGTNLSNFFLYYIKIDKGLLCADRVTLNSFSWDSINVNKLAQGTSIVIDGVNIVWRSPTGGVAYLDANGNKALTDQGLGAWPTNNEWDKYIVNFPAYKVQAGKTLDDVFHWSGVYTWTQDTVALGVLVSTTMNTSTTRTVRGNGKIDRFWDGASDTAYSFVGFRPVFEYKEV